MLGGLHEVEGRSGVDVVCCEDGHIVVAAVVAVTGVATDVTVAAVVVEVIGVTAGVVHEIAVVAVIVNGTTEAITLVMHCVGFDAVVEPVATWIVHELVVAAAGIVRWLAVVADVEAAGSYEMLLLSWVEPLRALSLL